MVAVQARGSGANSTEGSFFNGEQSSEPPNAPSNAQKRKLSHGLDIVLPSLPLGSEADIAGSKKSKVRRDDQGSNLTKLHYWHVLGSGEDSAKG